MALLYYIALFDILHDLIEAESFSASSPFWCKPIGRQGNWVFLHETPSQNWNIPHMSFVMYQDNNNQQGCAYILVAAHTHQIAISPVSITERAAQGDAVGLRVEGIYDPR